MGGKRESLLVTAVLALAAGAAAVLVLDGEQGPGQERKSEEFQRLLGGLGFGPATDLSRCAFSFDPRVCPCCQEDTGLIPGGAHFCPHHGCSIFSYPPLDRRGEVRGEGGRSVLLP
jgi:hypothetical protein